MAPAPAPVTTVPAVAAAASNMSRTIAVSFAMVESVETDADDGG